ncbi:acetaldehyde dehydrogenase (acetylating) [Pelagibaculum spongiae]|uniref:Acetaldehyde dehydrogenase (Acetylating) n=1 Tax=Pelagibaculum spongiae TaxID=2080658 RepID=A0A2V1GZK9_9GAMM|nr:acetaldehyde dehydrogenase (acetylating) [Pelagibaculum spongiae]PVZ72484.1 acetaldehyde dehydrogenase (acetylating) [Pelagibaculum spongiae]
MEGLDRDLLSVQEVRNLIRRATKAQQVFADFDQQKVDSICRELALAGERDAVRLAEMAVAETGFGKVEDKTTKNLLASRILLESIKDMRTIGIIEEVPEKKLIKVGVPFGVVAALIPSTNPTSTTIYKAIISLKAGNAVIMSPHPGALKSISETVRILKEVLHRCGVSEDMIGLMLTPTQEGTKELMSNSGTGIILATGGSAMVHAAYSSGNPALGVGPGNVPAFIERSADIEKAARHIVLSKTFDYGTVCASEQHVVTESCIAEKVKQALVNEDCYFLNHWEIAAMEKLLTNARGGLNAKVVGKSAMVLAEMAGITVPEGTRVLVAEQPVENVGKKYPFSWEKLCPTLGFYVVEDSHQACNHCIELLTYMGAGHTLALHTKDDALVREFALKKPVSRLVVNTPSTHGGVGATTGISPAFTLGCGSVGGSATSDNVTPLNLLNIRYVAYGICEPEELAAAPVCSSTAESCNQAAEVDVDQLTKLIMQRLQNI